MPRVLAVAGCLLVSGLSLMPNAQASETPGPELTRRVLDWIEQKRGQRTSEDMKAARRLNAMGTKSYKERQYGDAQTAFENSYPNFPNAYAYIMTGDSHWRAVVQFQESEGRKPENRPPACSMDNKYFAHDVTTDVAQHHEVGLALAQHENEQHFLKSTFYRRARESATCLQKVASFYEAQPPTACVDIAKLRRCLGAPLIK